jgi:hypothetical protein
VQELKEMLISTTKLDHCFNEHFEREIRHAPLLPEFCCRSSKESLWAENALANKVKVFISGTFKKK